MAQGEVAHHLQEDAKGHRRYAESMVANRAHRNYPRDDNRNKGCPCNMRIDAFHRTEPEESNKEERDTSNCPEE